MALDRDFADILEEKLGSPAQSASVKAQATPEMKERFEPILSFFDAPKTWVNPARVSRYPKANRMTGQASQPQWNRNVKEKPKTEFHFSVAEASETLKQAMSQFIMCGAELDRNHFSVSDIKREYRRLLKTSHPDLAQGKAATETFPAILASYRTILSEVSK